MNGDARSNNEAMLGSHTLSLGCFNLGPYDIKRR